MHQVLWRDSKDLEVRRTRVDLVLMELGPEPLLLSPFEVSLSFSLQYLILLDLP